MMEQLHIPDIPLGVKREERLVVKVRPEGMDTWQTVPLYAARIDMHDVRQCAVGMFDFEGRVEVQIEPQGWLYIYEAVLRPVSKGIVPEVTGGRIIRFTLDKPVDLMLEINGERFKCLHLFARPMMSLPDGDDVIHVKAKMNGPSTAPAEALTARLAKQGGTVLLEPGLHIVGEYLFHIPSDSHIVLAPGAVVVGAFILKNVENVRIEGHGVILQESFHRFSGINGLRISHCKNVVIDGLTLINPPHYSVYLGGSEDVTISHFRSFSCEGWSDGIDMMSCRRIRVSNCFLRTSDDCIAIYGRRWAYNGDAQDILVERCTLWADVAHPINMGTHGDAEHDGNVIERVTFRDIDILEHHEHQPGYLGCIAINPGDKNTVQDVLFEDIRVEHIEHGKLLDIQVKFNPDYNPAPGKAIRRITLRNVSCVCQPQVRSVIQGYSEQCRVEDVLLENVQVCGKIFEPEIGAYTDRITIKGDNT